ncbi:hypothetical protein ATCVCanal1_776R [Acanthocystis turfacea Chlorella virus Canal-1]|nr:hypothetical protein ATCVCanal1_776R [Acanthocystis turfacea Chlorella virus Canal-1]
MSILFDITNASVPSLPSTKGIIIDTAKKTTTDLTVRFADMLVAAAGIVAALSWNDAFKSLFVEGGMFYRFAKGGPWIAAVVITLFAIWLGFWRSKLIPPTPQPKK